MNKDKQAFEAHKSQMDVIADLIRQRNEIGKELGIKPNSTDPLEYLQERHNEKQND